MSGVLTHTDCKNNANTAAVHCKTAPPVVGSSTELIRLAVESFVGNIHRSPNSLIITELKAVIHIMYRLRMIT